MTFNFRIGNEGVQKTLEYGKIVRHTYQHQFGCGNLKMVGPKKQDFWAKVNILKGNHCIVSKKNSFEHVDSQAKIFHFRTHHL